MTQPFQFANGQLAYSAEDLLKLCQQFPADGTNYLVREDIEKWLSYIGKNDIAEFAASARQAALDDRQKLEEFLNKCHALSSPPTESAVTETSNPVMETTTEQTSPAIESPVVGTPEEQTPIAVEPPPAPRVSEPSPVVTKSADTSTPPTNKTSESAVSSTPTEEKPSFFKAIATIFLNISNIFNRGKD
ncbi:hypothetical protein [Pleurocapsa sp. PCC 7319]|uniref:hypothetical protein n=1 Tax=Pleurocapsa sp. PCC 7319 TaxID=118161 RepID=UPI0003456A8C|nr:hypothetical protein [Pleurocapsa sp. PCC 7319]